MSEVRVTYSGLIGLLVGLSTIITGSIFILIVTRSLPQEELGTWGLIGGLITYVIIIEPMISYWVTRETARDIQSGKTAVFSSSIFSIIGLSIFLVIAFVVSEPSGVDPEILYFASLMIPLSFLNRTLSAIALGWKPEINHYGVLIFDIAKVPFALFFIIFMDMGIFGVILAIILAYIPSNTVLGILLKNKIQHKFNKVFLRDWLKRAWLPSYIKFPTLVVLDVLIFSLITGSVLGLAYWVTANAVGTIVRHSNKITRAVYPKLLGGGHKEFLQDSLVKFCFFAFPFMAVSIAFAKPALFALNPLYDIAVLVVIFITLRSFIKQLGDTFVSALQGIDKVDVKQSSQKAYLKSSLFFLPTIRLIRRAVYLSTLAIGLLILVQSNASQIDLVIYWAILIFIIEIPFTVYYYYLVRKQFPLSVDVKALTKYFIISIGSFGSVYIIMEEFLEYKSSIFEFLPSLVPYLVLGITAYFGITYITDKRTRKLFNAIFSEITKKINRLN